MGAAEPQTVLSTEKRLHELLRLRLSLAMETANVLAIQTPSIRKRGVEHVCIYIYLSVQCLTQQTIIALTLPMMLPVRYPSPLEQIRGTINPFQNRPCKPYARDLFNLGETGSTVFPRTLQNNNHDLIIPPTSPLHLLLAFG